MALPVLADPEEGREKGPGHVRALLWPRCSQGFDTGETGSRREKGRSTVGERKRRGRRK